MCDGSYKICRILNIYLPGESKKFCNYIYRNENDFATFHLDWGGISVPDIFFNSKEEADVWFLEKKLESVQKELEEEKESHKRTRDKLTGIRKVLRYINKNL